MSAQPELRAKNSVGTELALTILLLLLPVIPLANASAWAQDSPQPQQPFSDTSPQSGTPFGTISPYLGLPIDEIEFPAIAPDEATYLIGATSLKVGEPLTRENLHNAMQALFATGRFSDIQAEADPTKTAGVRLRFLTTPNFFVGIVTIQGVSTNPSPNQLASATRLQLGELFTKDKLARALEGIQRMMEENGFHQSRTTSSQQQDVQQHQINLTFHVIPGRRAVTGIITLQGDAGYSVEQIKEIAHLKSGDPVFGNRITRALQRIRKRYQKQNRLLAQVEVANRSYHADHNSVDYVLKVERGPVVEIAAEGFKLSQHVLKRLVPIYEEGAVDDDLLNEGRRSIQNHLQTLGYFDVTVTVNQHTTLDGRNVQIVYAINPGDRHKLAAIRITGNKFFSDELIRARMQEQAAGRVFSHGRYSEVLLKEDVARVRSLYQVERLPAGGSHQQIAHQLSGKAGRSCHPDHHQRRTANACRLGAN